MSRVSCTFVMEDHKDSDLNNISIRFCRSSWLGSGWEYWCTPLSYVPRTGSRCYLVHGSGTGLLCGCGCTHVCVQSMWTHGDWENCQVSGDFKNVLLTCRIWLIRLYHSRYWANVEIPHGTNGFQAVCPFCATPLDGATGYIKLIFQDNLD